MKKRNAKRLLVMLTAAALTVGGTAACTQEAKAVNTFICTSQLNVDKILSINGTKFPNVDSFTVRLTPVSAHLNDNIQEADGKDLAASKMPMPDGYSGQSEALLTIDNFLTSQSGDKAKSKERENVFNMTFGYTGYYMYKLEEVIPEDYKVPGMTYDTNTYYVVFYVTREVDDDGNTLLDTYVNSVTVWKNDGSSSYTPDLSDIANVTDNNGEAAIANDSKETTGKVEMVGKDGTASVVFWNDLEEQDVTLKKEIKGNLGDTTKYFTFDVTIQGAEKNVTYTLEHNSCATTGAADTTSGTIEDGSSLYTETFTTDDNGNASFTVRLKDDGELTFKDLPVTAKYQFAEHASNHAASYSITSDEGGNYVSSQASNSVTAQALSTEMETVDSGEKNTVVTFSNTRNLKPVTGVKGSYTPYAGIIAAAAAGLYVMGRKKRKNAGQQ